MTNELFSSDTVQLMLSVSRGTVDNLVSDGCLSRYQPTDVKRPLAQYRRDDLDAYLLSVHMPGVPAINYEPIGPGDPLVAAPELARNLELRLSDIESWGNARQMPSYLIRRTRRYRLSEIVRWLEACAAAWSSKYLPNRPTRVISATPAHA